MSTHTEAPGCPIWTLHRAWGFTGEKPSRAKCKEREFPGNRLAKAFIHKDHMTTS